MHFITCYICYYYFISKKCHKFLSILYSIMHDDLKVHILNKYVVHSFGGVFLKGDVINWWLPFFFQVTAIILCSYAFIFGSALLSILWEFRRENLQVSFFHIFNILLLCTIFNKCPHFLSIFHSIIFMQIRLQRLSGALW